MGKLFVYLQITKRFSQMINPFLANSEFNLKVVDVYHRRYKTIKEYSIVEETTKNIVEKQEFINLYKIGNCDVYTSFLFNVLNSQGRDLFLYILANIGRGKDQIKLDYSLLQVKMNISKNTYYKAVNNLKDNSVIASYRKGIYWINPYFFFRGDRIKYYKTNCPDCIDVVGKVTSGETLTEYIKNDKG